MRVKYDIFIDLFLCFIAETRSQEQESRAKLAMTINESKIDSSMVIANLAYDPWTLLLTLWFLKRVRTHRYLTYSAKDTTTSKYEVIVSFTLYHGINPWVLTLLLAFQSNPISFQTLQKHGLNIDH